MIVLVADKFEQSGLDGIAELGHEVRYEPALKDDALRAGVIESSAEILIVRSTKVPAEVMEGSKLRLVIRAGAGYNTIDVAAATRLGIYVANCPGKNSQAVAELAFGLLLSADRHIPDNVADLRAGKWNKKAFSQARGLCGRTLGLVGLGMIGKEMIPRAKAFGMRVVAHSQWLDETTAKELGIEKVSLDDLAEQSDYVSVHCSLRPETKGLLGPEFFSKIKQGAVFVNTSRAEVVDQAALLEAVHTRDVVAGLDVFEGEPDVPEGDYSGTLRYEPQVYCTHHIGASTVQAQQAVADEVVRIVRFFEASGTPPNAVNEPVSAGVR